MLSAINLNSQEFNGEYTSNKTSFKDESNEGNNFVEHTQFIIALHIKENEGFVAIQDPRIPNTPLIYRIIKEESVIRDEEIKLFIYKTKREDLKSNENSQLTLYIKEEEVNLMVSNSKSSQVFHNLKTKY